jgi:hypothetical protein
MVLGAIAGGIASAAAAKLLAGKGKKTTTGPTGGTTKKTGTEITEKTLGKSDVLDPAAEKAYKGGLQSAADFIGQNKPTGPVEFGTAGQNVAQTGAFGAAPGITDFASGFLDPAQSYIGNVLGGGSTIDPTQLSGYAGARSSLIDPMREQYERAIRAQRLRSRGTGQAGGTREAELLANLTQRSARDQANVTGNLNLGLVDRIFGQRNAALAAVPGLSSAYGGAIQQQANLGGQQQAVEQIPLSAQTAEQQAQIANFIQGLKQQNIGIDQALRFPGIDKKIFNTLTETTGTGGDISEIDPLTGLKYAGQVGSGVANYLQGADLSSLKKMLLNIGGGGGGGGGGSGGATFNPADVLSQQSGVF